MYASLDSTRHFQGVENGHDNDENAAFEKGDAVDNTLNFMLLCERVTHDASGEVTAIGGLVYQPISPTTELVLVACLFPGLCDVGRVVA